MAVRPFRGGAPRYNRRCRTAERARLDVSLLDRPMDFADATLVYLAKRESLSAILTVDHADFATYRIEGKRQFRILPVKQP